MAFSKDGRHGPYWITNFCFKIAPRRCLSIRSQLFRAAMSEGGKSCSCQKSPRGSILKICLSPHHDELPTAENVADAWECAACHLSCSEGRATLHEHEERSLADLMIITDFLFLYFMNSHFYEIQMCSCFHTPLCVLTLSPKSAKQDMVTHVALQLQRYMVWWVNLG